MTNPLPPTWAIEPDEGLRTKDDGTTLLGGAPMGVIRLSESGAAIAAGLFRGEPVGTSTGRADLARRLLDRGMAHPVPTLARPVADAGSVSVVIPVRDDREGVIRTLGSLPPVDRVVIVDDGSTSPLSLPADATHSPLTVVHNASNLGPGGARNRGLAETESEFVLFIDADVTLGETTLVTLLSHFDDQDVVAVGPRIVDRPGGPTGEKGVGRLEASTLDRYENGHSPLDLGHRPSAVRPGAVVSYLPTACLLVRRRALAEIGPFDPGLRFGEDVDLVWRLRSIGTVRYVPGAVARHPHRSTIRAFVHQRVGYGSSAGPLARRHGAAVAPLRCSGWTLSILALALGGHGLLAALLHAGTTRALVPKLGALSDPLAEAARLTTTGNVWAARTFARGAVRVWWPIVLVGLAAPPTRLLARRWLAWSLVERTVVGRETDPRQVAMGLLDDAAYGTGVWLGVIRARTIVPLLPATGGQSTSGRLTIKSSNWTTSRVSTLRRRISAFSSS